MSFPYQDKTLQVDERVTDLLGRMTLDEKLAQMSVVYLPKDFTFSDDADLVDLKMIHGVGGLDRLGMHRSSSATAAVVNALQSLLKTKTRLGIPAFIIDEALHGLMGQGATSFPQAIALASSWDSSLVEKVFTVTAAEMSARGGNWALSPVLDLARDPRWGRTEETYGEDPYLVAHLGVAAIKGLQSSGLVMATAKHFAVHGQPEAGNNCAPANYSEREIRSVFLEPFRAAVQDGGVGSVMASYNEVNSIPVHINHWLLQDVLRQEWGFDGLLTSDGYGISCLMSMHYVAENAADAARQALLAGIEYELDSCFPALKEQVLSGQVSEAIIDQAVSHILRQKFMLGLFDQPHRDLQQAELVVGCSSHAALALEAARKCIVLLKNDTLSGGQPVLPLDIMALRKLAVIGPNAAIALRGGYSAEAIHEVSVLDGLRQYLGDAVELLYAEGCRITEAGGGWQSWWKDDVRLPDEAEEEQRISAAVEVARKADAAILVLGENEFICREAWSPSHLGDRDSLDLPGQQEKLIKAIVETGTPTVLVLFNGRPLSIQWAAQHVPAILECWYLGQEGGTAVAEVLFGKTNPGGRLPITFPRSVGQIPAYYYHKPSARRGYLFSESGPLFPFGHGLSYTTFEYSDLKIDPAECMPGDEVHVSVTVSNTGDMAGDEVVQLYLRDSLSSVTRPVKELKGFQRVFLKPGDRQQVRFTLTAKDLSLLNVEMRWIVEPGEFEVMIGGSSAKGLTARFNVLATGPSNRVQ